MILQMNIPDDEARMFEVSARKRSMTVEEWLMYCAFKQLSQEYSFIVADADDLEKKLEQGMEDVRNGNTAPADEVFARIRASLSNE
jgi:hypothetical protein